MFVNKYLIKIIYLFVFSFVLLSSMVYSFDSVYVWSNNVISSTFDSSSQISETTTTAIENENLFQLESGSAILIEQHSAQILYSQNCHEKLRPASVTKIMSILLIMEAVDSGRLKYTDTISCSEHAASMGGSQIWLDTREELTVDEMLKAICIASANDCTVAMAEYLAGTEESFVAQMNEKAKQLGMNDTVFKNCHGIDEDGHFTSSYDIALMSKELLNNHPDITKYTSIWMDSLRDGKSELVNTNKLVRTYPGATGLKTGSTSLALYNLSASATRNGLSLIAVVMKAPSTAVRFAEAKKLLDYGFNTYEYKEFAKKGDLLSTLPVEKGIEKKIDVVFKENVGFLLKKGEHKNITEKLNLPDMIFAPLSANSKVGEITYSMNGNDILTSEIVIKHDLKKLNLGNMLAYIYKCWFTLNRL